MSTLRPEEYPTHVQVVGWVFLGMGLLLLVGGLGILVFFGGLGVVGTIGVLTLDEGGGGSGNPFGCLGCFGLVALVVATVLALPGIVAGIGLLTKKTWGQMVGILVGAINLINFPVGTLIGGYALWILTHEHSAAYFGKEVNDGEA